MACDISPVAMFEFSLGPIFATTESMQQNEPTQQLSYDELSQCPHGPQTYYPAQRARARVDQNSKKFSKSHGLLIYFVPTWV